MSQLVLLLLLVPLAGGLVTLFVRNAGHKFARNLALGFFLLNLFISFKLTWDYLPLLEKHSISVEEKLTFVPLESSVTVFDLIRIKPPHEGRPDAALNFLKEIGANNIIFTDGASSSGLMSFP